MRIRVSTEIALPRHVVWRYVRELDRHVEWMGDAVEIRFLTESRAGVGTRFDTVTRVGPLTTTDRMTVTEWQEGRVIGVSHDGAVSGEGCFDLRDLDGGRTRFTWSESLDLPWYLGGSVGEIVARPILTALWRRNLRKLRARLESA
jgi:Polyketide cyclase / dehydrase and lipid transport